MTCIDLLNYGEENGKKFRNEYMMKSIAIIGGGAAGFFAAANINNECGDITIYEASTDVLTKVAISGGGRCNLTNSFESHNIAQAYPRGGNLMKKLFKIFDHKDAYEWVENSGVKLFTQEDGCVFPFSQNAQDIRHLLMEKAEENGAEIKLLHRVNKIEFIGEKFHLGFKDESLGVKEHDIILLTTGGCKLAIVETLNNLGISIIKPIPSLFGFKIEEERLRELSGTMMKDASISLQGMKTRTSGAILITHQGLSGPSVLKLSSYLAPDLENMDYKFKIAVNWTNSSEEKIRKEIEAIIKESSKKLVINYRPLNLSSRFWEYLLARCEISLDRKWGELGSKSVNKLINILTNDSYQVDGRTSHQEEFVTCGGVALNNIDSMTLESKTHPNLHFAGEVLDIDAITGGFNLQAAWTTGYAVALSINNKTK